MFTGIVEHIGIISEYTTLDTSAAGGNGVLLTISEALPILGDVHLGDSIAVNGVCLTVTEFTESTFKIGMAPETLARSNLGELTVGSRVNLERAVSGEVRFGGHFVQGHVDTVATIVSITADSNSLRFVFQLRDTANINYIVEKGFVAVDGTSLTVTQVDHQAGTFGIMMVAYTQDKVVMSKKAVGQTVNVEVDLTGKLVERQIEALMEREYLRADGKLAQLVERIVERKLAERS